MNLNDQKVVQKDMDFLYLGNLKTVTFNLALPAKGKYGSEISWSSGEERFLDTDGRVNRPLYGMGNREVLLTGTFTYGEATASKVYAVTILEQENPHQNADTYPIEVTVQGRPDKDAEVYQNAEAEIRILPGNAFYEAQERMHQYLLSMDDDSMLYHFRKASGLDTRGADSPDGWDADESKLKGHTTGHYLSALALCYRATGDEKIREKAVYMVDELGECQRAFQNIDGIQEGFLSAYSEEQFDLLEEYTPYPKIWAPYYTLHKIIAGLLDCYLYIDKKEALSIAEQMGVWTWHRLSRLPEAQLKKMWSMYIAGEFGGMNVVMTQLAELTGREEFLKCARLFDNDKLYRPLMRYQDQLNGIHANQHIPQILGAIEIYKASGDLKYLEMARAFWTTVTENRTYATGGVGEGEMFQGYREIGKLLTASTQETCASYNMLKLTRELYQMDPDSRYMDYYEKTLYNHILATPDESGSGESTYFFPLGPGMKREFLFENSCCHGTGMESHFKYQEGMYFQKRDALFINMYIPSEFSQDDMRLHLECVSQRRQEYELRIQNGTFRKLYLRYPEWADECLLEMDGEVLETKKNKDGYIEITMHSGDMRLQLRWMPGWKVLRTPDEPEKAAIQYGPYIMAAISDEEEFLELPMKETEIAEQMEWTDEHEDELSFRLGDWKWIPVYEVGDKAYHVYTVIK